MNKAPTRRRVTAGLALGALAAPSFGIRAARAQAKSVKIAMIAPLSGPWARQGQLLRMGSDMAIDDINSQGGIKALGGAKLEIIYADAGDNTEKAKNAAQRLLSDHLGRHRGDGARRAAVAHALLLRRDHQSRVQIRLPDLADCRLASCGDAADRH
jgi:hypothetical protein